MSVPLATASLVDEVIRAHGGAEVFDAAAWTCVRLSAGGPAFRLKGHRGLRDAEVRVATHGQRVEVAQPGGVSFVFDGCTITAVDPSGGRRHRPRPREHLRGFRPLVRWDALDLGYFACAALWTYGSIPWVLGRPDYQVRELAAVGGRRRLEAILPPRTHSHGRRHVLWIDDEGLIERHDYTSMMFGRFATMAQLRTRHEWHDGLRIPMQRRIQLRPLGAGHVTVPRPYFVSVDVSDAWTEHHR